MQKGGTVPTGPAQNELDQRAQAALANIRLDLFTVTPATISPFATARISWEVTGTEESGVSVDFDIDGTPVATSGQLQVAPESTTSYRLRAQALGHSRILGTVTVEVDLAMCIALSAEPVDLIADVIKYQIKTESGIYFRSTSDPIVSIQGDRMVVSLRLADDVKYFPDPSIDIDASFSLDVVPIPREGRALVFAGISAFDYDFHRLAPASETVTVDVSFPWYAWLVPGAILGLPIATSGAEAKGYERAAKMIDDIVKALNGWFTQSYVQPPKMDKHDAGFYVNPQQDQRFWITFCPGPNPISSSAP
jgi:hypothetical protein